MRYALTVNPDHDNWDAVETYIIEAPSVDSIKANLEDILLQLLQDENRVKFVLSGGGEYFIRHFDDIDYSLERAE